MAKSKVFVSRVIRDKGLDLVKEFCQVDLWTDELPPPRATLLERVRGVDGLLCLLTDRVDGELLDAAGSGLKVVSNHAVGVDNIDLTGSRTARRPGGQYAGDPDRRHCRFCLCPAAGCCPAGGATEIAMCGTVSGKPGGHRSCWDRIWRAPPWGLWVLDASARRWPGGRAGLR